MFYLFGRMKVSSNGTSLGQARGVPGASPCPAEYIRLEGRGRRQNRLAPQSQPTQKRALLGRGDRSPQCGATPAVQRGTPAHKCSGDVTKQLHNLSNLYKLTKLRKLQQTCRKSSRPPHGQIRTRAALQLVSDIPVLREYELNKNAEYAVI